MHPARVHYDKILFTAALLVAIGSLEWMRRGQATFRSVKAETPTRPMSGLEYQQQKGGIGGTAAPVWSVPSAQSLGSDWLFELFTPPLVGLDSAGRIVTSATKQAPAVIAAEPPQLELLAVQPEPFRVQLAGYFVSPSGSLAMLASGRTKETWVVREGDRIAGLGLSLQHLAVRKTGVRGDEAGLLREEVATVLLWDEWAHREVTLDSRKILLTDEACAVLHVGKDGRRREVRAGDTFAADGFHYRVDRIDLEPAGVTVGRSKSDSNQDVWQMFRLTMAPSIPVGDRLTSLAIDR